MGEWTERYAYDLSDIRVVMGSRNLRQRCHQAAHTTGKKTHLARIRNDSGGVRVSAHVPAVSGIPISKTRL